MPDRLEYIKQKLEEQKKSPAVILRHSDGEWAVDEIERIREENERLNKIIDSTSHSIKDIQKLYKVGKQ